MGDSQSNWAERLGADIGRELLPIVAISGAINLLILASPIYMLQVYDRVLLSGSYATLIFVSLMALVAFVGLGYFDVIRATALTRIGEWVQIQNAPHVFDAMLLKSRTTGYQGIQPLRDLQSLQQFVGSPTISAFLDAPFAPIFIILTFMLHWSIGLLTVFGGIILFAVAVIADRSSRETANKIREAEIDSTLIADEFLRGSDFVSSSGMRDIALDKFEAANSLRQRKVSRVSLITGASSSVSKVLRLTLQSASLGLGSLLVISPNIAFTAGGMIAGSILMARALAPIEQSINAWRYYNSAAQSLSSLKQLAAQSERKNDAMVLPSPKGHVTLEDVASYPLGSTEPLFSGLDASIKPGSLVCLVGPSGSGKTTLCRILAGIDRPSRGAVRVDDTDLRNWRETQKGKFLGYLPQTPIFFEGTIAQNIARFASPISDADVFSAAEQVGAHQLISQQSSGYATIIGARGKRLSGGQSQTIGLARANFENPAILVLDEPTAHLDSAGRKTFFEFVESAITQARTVFVATHDPWLLQRSEVLIIFESGTAEVRYNKHAREKRSASKSFLSVQKTAIGTSE